MKRQLIDFLNSKFVRGNINRNDRAGALHRAWGHVYTNFIEGDYFEFGVYKGDSLVESYKNYLKFREWIICQTKSEEAWRREAAKNFISHVPAFHGLDTFEGMPVNNEGDVTFAAGNFAGSLDGVAENCARSGLRPPQLVLHKGLFKDIKGQLYASGVKKAAILNIDSDLYESAKDALDVASPFIQVGTVVMFDDYNIFCADNTKGERRAFHEFCQTAQRKFEPWFSYAFVGQTFLCVA